MAEQDGAAQVEIRNFEPETQFFGFSPVAFVDDVINAVNDYLFDGAETLLELLVSADKSFDEDAVRKSINKILNFLQDKVDKYFDKFEMYCFTSIFKIPQSLHLPSDLPAVSGEVGDDGQIERELQETKQQLIKASFMNKCLRKELADLQTVNAALERQVRDKKSLLQACRKAEIMQPSESIKFVFHQFDKMVALLATETLTSAKTTRQQFMTLEEMQTDVKRRKTAEAASHDP